MKSCCAPSEVPLARRCCRASHSVPIFSPTLAGWFTRQTPSCAGFPVPAKVSFTETALKGEGWLNLGFSWGLCATACCSLMHRGYSQLWTSLQLWSCASPQVDGIEEWLFQLKTNLKPEQNCCWFDSFGNNPFAPHTALVQPLESKLASACGRGR